MVCYIVNSQPRNNYFIPFLRKQGESYQILVNVANENYVDNSRILKIESRSKHGERVTYILVLKYIQYCIQYGIQNNVYHIVYTR